MTAKRIVGVGVPTLDRTYRVDEAPRFDHSVLAHASASEGGGQVATALVAASRLGHHASMIGVVGGDAEGQLILSGFADDQVDTSLVVVAESGRSSSAFILVNPQGQRAIMYDPGHGIELTLTDAAAAAILEHDGLLLERNDPASLAAARVARRSGTTTLLDLDAFLGEVPELVALSDIVIASEAVMAGRSAEETLDGILTLGVNQAVVTCGSAGAIGKDRQGTLHRHNAYDAPVVDTTGAGDVYHGAYLAAHLEGASLSEAMQFAAVVAGLKCRSFGGRSGIPQRREVDDVVHGLEGTI